MIPKSSFRSQDFKQKLERIKTDPAYNILRQMLAQNDKFASYKVDAQLRSYEQVF